MAVVVGEVLVALRQGQDAAGAVGAGEAAEAEVLGRGRAAVLDVTVVSTLDAATAGTAGAAVTADAGAAATESPDQAPDATIEASESGESES